MLFGAAFGIVWRSLKDVWEDAFLLALNNLVWFGLTLAGPMVAYGAWQLIQVPVITWATIAIAALVIPMAAAGMQYVTNRTANARAIHVSDLFEGMKRYWWRSWVWLLVNLFLLYVLYLCVGFYTSLVSGFFQVIIGGLWLGIAVLWLMMQMYFWPMLITQSNPGLLRAWRNSFVLVAREPLYSLIIAICIIGIIALSILFSIAIMIFTMAVVGLICNNATLALLARSGAIELPRRELKI